MKRLFLIALAACAMLAQQGTVPGVNWRTGAVTLQAGDARPPEAGPNVPRCSNSFRMKAGEKCSCNKAVSCHGDGDAIPQGMAKWCTQQCHKDKCGCVSPCETRNLKPCKPRAA